MLKLAFGVLAVALVTATPALADGDGPCAGAPLVVPIEAFKADATGLQNGLPADRVRKIFAHAGITVSWTPDDSPLEIVDYAMDYAGDGARLDSALSNVGLRNILKQSNGNPVSFNFTFARPVQSVQFRRAPLHAGASGVTNPAWTATARSANGLLVDTVSEAEIRSYIDVPGRTFTLAGPQRITSVEIDGDDRGVDGQANAVLDSLGWCP